MNCKKGLGPGVPGSQGPGVPGSFSVCVGEGGGGRALSPYIGPIKVKKSP